MIGNVSYSQITSTNPLEMLISPSVNENSNFYRAEKVTVKTETNQSALQSVSTINNSSIAVPLEVAKLRKNVLKLEGDIKFMQDEHKTLLVGLQRQVEQLRLDNQELQFQLIMHNSRPPEDPKVNSDTIKTLVDNNKYQSVNVNGLYNQIEQLQKFVEEEKTKNKELQSQLKSLQNYYSQTRDSKDPLVVSDEKLVEISPEIRVSFTPLRVAKYNKQKDTFIANSQPTVDDCEMVIRHLLEQRVSSVESLQVQSATSKTKQQHKLSKPTTQKQSIVQQPSSSSHDSYVARTRTASTINSNKPIRLTPLVNTNIPTVEQYVSTSTTPLLTGLSANTRILTPILPSKIHDFPPMSTERSKEENIVTAQLPSQLQPNFLTTHSAALANPIGTTNHNNSTTNTCDSSTRTKLHIGPAVALPALPTRNQGDHAERHRRLQAVQKKRLDLASNTNNNVYGNRHC